jgi:primosomal protein N' (replication factor Y)
MSDLFQLSTPSERTGHAGSWHYMRVAVERGIDQEGSGAGLTYKSPQPVELGRRVEVPLGRGNTASAGIVIATGGEELLDGFAPERVKAIARDTGTGLTPQLVELARWMAAYYVCPLGMVLAAMLPAAVKKKTGSRTITVLSMASAEVVESVLGAAPIAPSAAQAWTSIQALSTALWPMTPQRLAAELKCPTLGPINRLIRSGLLVESDAEDIRASGGVSTQMGIEQADPTGGAALDVHRPTLTAQQTRVVDGIGFTLGKFGVHLLRGVTGSGKTEVYLRVLERVLERGQRAIVLVPEISLTPQTAGRFVERFRSAGVAVLHSGLSASQRNKEWSRVATGSARVVVGARSAIFAPVENVGLVVVDEEHASDYKQDQLPRYHGRDVAIKRAHLGGCPVILGSATPSLESWINAQARVAASVRDGGREMPLQAGPKYALWELTERVGTSRMPKVQIVDMAEERKIRRVSTGKDDAHLHLLGPTLERAMTETLNDNGQVLLLMNRRGYSAYIACPNSSCGWVMTCDDCDARMVQHRIIAGQPTRKGVVRCHHCLAQKLLPEKCPVCTTRTIALGLGTQRVEEEIAKKFARYLKAPKDGLQGESGTAAVPVDDLADFDAAISERATDFSPSTPHTAHTNGMPELPGLARVDGDSMASAKDYFETLSRFARGEIKVLLGTQMIAKGLDFPNVRLVGVINADTALSLPDFRASERTFQLVSQVAGRAGRGKVLGRVIVQTFDPNAEAIVKAAEHDYVSFANEEIKSRRMAGLPPITRMARIVLRDEQLPKAEAHAQLIASELKSVLARHAVDSPVAARTRIDGPMPCPISRIAGFHRLAIEIVSPQRMLIQQMLAELRSKGILVSDSRTAIDIDPIALM